MELASRHRVQAVAGDLLPLAATEDLFLLFCNEGRRDKVVLGLTDTMYKKRLSTAGELNSMAKGGFKNLLRQAGAIPASGDVDFIFMQNLGYTDPQKPKFELLFDHFLDACQDVSSALYPSETAEGALRALFAHHLAPLAHSIFGAELIESAAASDAGSVLSGRTGATRVTSLVLTPKGTAPVTALWGTSEPLPAVPMLVTSQPHVGPVPGSSVPLASPGGATYPRQPMSVRLTGSGATPDNGRASVLSSGIAGGGSASRPVSWGRFAVTSPPPALTFLGAIGAPGSGGAASVRLRSPLPLHAAHHHHAMHHSGALTSPTSAGNGLTSPMGSFRAGTASGTPTTTTTTAAAAGLRSPQPFTASDPAHEGGGGGTSSDMARALARCMSAIDELRGENQELRALLAQALKGREAGGGGGSGSGGAGGPPPAAPSSAASAPSL